MNPGFATRRVRISSLSAKNQPEVYCPDPTCQCAGISTTCNVVAAPIRSAGCARCQQMGCEPANAHSSPLAGCGHTPGEVLWLNRDQFCGANTNGYEKVTLPPSGPGLKRKRCIAFATHCPTASLPVELSVTFTPDTLPCCSIVN